MEAFTHRRLALDSGVEIALLDWGGEGPLALLHHANGFCAGVFGLVAEALRPTFRVVAMDARGHGLSSKPSGPEHYGWEHFGHDAAEVARRLADEHGGRVALGLGHSFGGTSLLFAAAHEEGLFDRLVAVDPVIPPPPGPEGEARRRHRGVALAEGARRRRHVFESREAARAAWSGKDFFARWDPRALDLYLRHGLLDRADGQVEIACPGEVEAAVFGGSRTLDLWRLADAVTAPTLLVWAERGDFPRALYEQFVARLPDGTLVDADSGHLVTMERPDLVAEHALAFCGARR